MLAKEGFCVASFNTHYKDTQHGPIRIFFRTSTGSPSCFRVFSLQIERDWVAKCPVLLFHFSSKRAPS